ncbi:MAG: TadE/TadG family type IV pilus assembly protein [Clostridia bacterium]
MEKYSNKSRLKGSATVEMIIVFPIILILLISVIYLMIIIGSKEMIHEEYRFMEYIREADSLARKAALADEIITKE